jgi:hypothetical protein
MKIMKILGLAALAALALMAFTVSPTGAAIGLGSSLCVCGAATSRIGKTRRLSLITRRDQTQITGTTASSNPAGALTETVTASSQDERPDHRLPNPLNDRKALIQPAMA